MTLTPPEPWPFPKRDEPLIITRLQFSDQTPKIRQLKILRQATRMSLAKAKFITEQALGPQAAYLRLTASQFGILTALMQLHSTPVGTLMAYQLQYPDPTQFDYDATEQEPEHAPGS